MATNTFRTRVVILVVILLAFVVGLLLLTSSNSQIFNWPDGQNVLANGSFEDGTGPGGPFKPDGSGTMIVTPGSTTIPSWTVTGAAGVEVTWLRNVNDYVPNGATDGSHFLDLTGYHDRSDPSGHFGGVTQTFPTVAGFDYHVFLDIGVFISSVSAKNLPGPISVIVGWSGPNGENPSEQTCGPFDATADGAQWHTCELPFHARTANTTVRIYGALGKHYIGLDRVMVQCVAPLGRHFFCTGRTLG
jgi:hypothetical protein